MFPSIHSLAAWLMPIALLGAAVLGTFLGHIPVPAVRWKMALVALSAPLFCPNRGLGSTIVTGLAVVIAVRLADLGARGDLETPLARLLWQVTPVVRRLPATAAERRHNRRLAPRTLLRAAAKGLCLQPLIYLAGLVEPAEVHWLVRSVYLILYFVLSLTALSDLALAFCQLLGAKTEELFDWPLLASSPRDFWSRRWNRFISRFALKHIALPLRRRRKSELTVTMAVFCASGVFHEYFALGAAGAASSPGAMFTFFGIQGIAVALGRRASALSRLPWLARHAGTLLWMTITAPLFFRAVVPPLLALGFPEPWLPWTPAAGF